MPRVLRRALVLTLALAVASAAWCADSTDRPPQEAAADTDGREPAGAFRYSGYASTRYIYRSAELGTEVPVRTAIDRDLRAQVRVDAIQPRERRYEWHLLASARGDLDGHQDATAYYPFEDIGDTGTRSAKGYLYEGHFDLNQPFRPLSQLRIGRQGGTRDDPIFFDGLAADVALARELKVVLYGGRAVHFFELNGTEDSDRLWGAGVDVQVLEPTTLKVDYLAARDLREPDTSRTDRQVAVKLLQQLGDHWRATLRGRNVNGQPRDVRLRVLGAVPAAALDVSAIYHRQIRTQNELAVEDSVYFDVLGQSYPFQSLDLKLRWQPGADYAFDLGVFRRELLDVQQEGPFNREFSRVNATFEVDNLFSGGVFASLTGERWRSTTTHAVTGGVETGYATKGGRRATRFAVGSYYSLYKYDYYVVLGERTRSRTNYLEARAPAGDHFLLIARYEHERADQFNSVAGIDTFQIGRLEVRYDF